MRSGSPKSLSTQGFTLIEVLVALAITSMIMALLMGATFYLLQIRVKLTEEVHIGEQSTRQHIWFRQIAGSVQPSTLNDPGRFQGTESGFQSWVLRPLNSDTNNAMERAELLLSPNSDIDGVNLVYKSSDNSLLLASWPNANARFTYLTAAGKEETIWNGRFQPDENTPRAIQLTVKSKDQDSLVDFWFALVDAEPWLDSKDSPDFISKSTTNSSFFNTN